MYYNNSPSAYPLNGIYQYNQPYNMQKMPSMEMAQQPQYYSNNNTNILKGRPVTSFEEARAAQIDLDGSLYVFVDIGNKKIYTKQLNLDGTATLNTYSLMENAPSEVDTSPTAREEYVTKTEFNQALNQIQEILNGFQKTNVATDNKSPMTF